MPRFLDPKNELVFKKIFGEHPDLLLDFLNAVLPLPADGQIAALSYLPAEQVPVLPPDNRRGIVDVKCTDCQGRVFIVEMQRKPAAKCSRRRSFWIIRRPRRR